MAKMMDAWAAGNVRQDLTVRTGSPQLVELLVPLQPKEAEARSRAQVLLSALAARLPSPSSSMSTTGSGSNSGATSNGMSYGKDSEEPVASPSGAVLPGTFKGPAGLISLRGTGPLGLLTPGDVVNVMNELRTAALQLWPRLEGLMKQPGAQELVSSLGSQLTARFAARAIKFVFGAMNAQQLLLSQRSRDAPTNAPAASTRPVSYTP